MPDGLPIGSVHRLLSVTSTEGFLQCLMAATNPNSDRVRQFLLPYRRIGESLPNKSLTIAKGIKQLWPYHGQPFHNLVREELPTNRRLARPILGL